MSDSMITNWVAIITLGLILASYIWTVSFKFARFEEKLDNVVREVHSMNVNVDKIPLIEYRLTGVENRLDKIETRMDKLEVRLTNVEIRLDKLEIRVEAIEKKISP